MISRLLGRWLAAVRRADFHGVARYAAVLALLLGTASPAAEAPVASDERVGAGLLTALEAGQPVYVMIAFDVPLPEPPNGRGPRNLATPAARAAIQARGDEILGDFRPGEFSLGWRYGSVRALSGHITARGLERLLANPAVLGVALMEQDHAQLIEARALGQVNRARSLGATGFTGAGITVAVLDTGVDPDHPDLEDDLVAQHCTCEVNHVPCCPAPPAGVAEDEHGHGTHVAGIITSDGDAAPAGVAPAADLVAIRVLDSAGYGDVDGIVAGLQWIIDTRPEVDIVNMSLSGGRYAGDCDNADPFTRAYRDAIDTLRAKGVTTFVAAGNNGWGTEMGRPACVQNAISVGNVHDSNYGRSPSAGDWCLDGNPPCTLRCHDTTTAADKVVCSSNANDKTDLFAPGGEILSSHLAGGTYTRTGTSMAAPFTAGCAALMLEQNLSGGAQLLTPDDVEKRLESSPDLVWDLPPRPGDATASGLAFPRVNCIDALQLECVSIDSTDPIVGDPSLPKAIPDESTISSTLSVPISGPVVDVNIERLWGTHANMADLEFRLSDPSLAVTTRLIDNVCLTDDDFDLGLDDATTTPIPCPPTDMGDHLPSEPLSVFVGAEASGSWHLEVEDQIFYDSGTLNAWALDVCVTKGCGNGEVEVGEQCDDGNLATGDGCSPHCEVEVCNASASTDVPKAIPDEGSVTSNLAVTVPGAITDVGMFDIGATHTWVGDLEFHLKSPATTDLTVIDQVCGSAHDITHLYLHDLALEPVGAVCPPVHATALTARPTHQLAAFDGETAAGTWELEVFDQSVLFTGTLDGWGLNVCSATCAIYTPLDMAQTIPDSGSVTSTLYVPADGTIHDLDVLQLAGTHPQADHDLEFQLESPEGTNVTILEDDTCTTTGGNFDLAVDDEAVASSCTHNDGLAHQAANPLSAFDGEDPQGAWTLEVFDRAAADVGALQSWALKICFSVCGNGTLEAGEDCDDGNTVGGDCCSATCAFEPATTVCRPGSGDLCDPNELCTGTTADCPDDVFEPPTSVCRPALGACDIAEYCPGSPGEACPLDGLHLPWECRPASGLCDIAEICPGDDPYCPADAVEPLTTLCRAVAGVCDAPDYCDGANAACAADAKLTTECRASAHACDAAELCDGVSDACGENLPANGLPCPDGDLCNGDEICVGWVCAAGTPLVCDDGDICTTDSCDAFQGCANDPIVGGGTGCGRRDLPSASPAGRVLLGLLVIAAGTTFLAGRRRFGA